MAKKESQIDIFIRYEGGNLRIESPLEIYPFEVKEILEKAHSLVCGYINEKRAGIIKPTHVKGTLKLVKIPEN
jgi:hypothetical protein